MQPEAIAIALLKLLATEIPPHLDNKSSGLALLGVRVFEGALTKIYRHLALLIHPDKHDSKKEFVEGFQKLGSLYDEFGKSTAHELKDARAIDWRFPAEHELTRLLCQQQGLPQPRTPPSPPPPPSQSAPQQSDGQAPPAFNLVEFVNMTTARLAQDLLAFRNLRISGDASKSWASVVQEQLDKVKEWDDGRQLQNNLA